VKNERFKQTIDLLDEPEAPSRTTGLRILGSSRLENPSWSY